MKRALAAALVALAAWAPAAVAQTHHTEAGVHTVAIGFGDFTPAHLDVLAGDAVTWRNDSVRQHTVTAKDDSWDSGRLGAGTTFRRRFDQLGHVDYYCRLHVINASLDVHRILLEDSGRAAGPGRPRGLSGRAAVDPGTELQIEADAGAGFAPIATATVAFDGAFELEVSPRATTSYRAVFGSEASPPVTFVVLDRRVSASVQRRGRQTLVGARVTPASPGVSAVLQLYLPHRFGWWPVRRARLDKYSRVRFAIPRGRRHRARVILTLPDGATITATSRTFLVGAGRAKRRHEPAEHGQH